MWHLVWKMFFFCCSTSSSIILILNDLLIVKASHLTGYSTSLQSLSGDISSSSNLSVLDCISSKSYLFFFCKNFDFSNYYCICEVLLIHFDSSLNYFNLLKNWLSFVVFFILLICISSKALSGVQFL